MTTSTTNMTTGAATSTNRSSNITSSSNIIPIEEAQEGYLPLNDDDDDSDNNNSNQEQQQKEQKRLWYRIWGLPIEDGGIPVLFVHGGPGNCISDYKNINDNFFSSKVFFVIEVDQRGTGRSEPSVRDLTPLLAATSTIQPSTTNIINKGVMNMSTHYKTITIQQMSQDFETLRHHLNISKWLIFGGSWGSTLGLYYATQNPNKCLGLIVRGIFLGIAEEMDIIYTRDGIFNLTMELLENKRKMEQHVEVKKDNSSEVCKDLLLDKGRYEREFEIFYNVANREYQRRQIHNNNNTIDNNNNNTNNLNPNNARRILELYLDLILQGNREAIWKFYVYEANLVAEEYETQRLDPNVIDEDLYAEAQSVSFFECILFYKMVYASSDKEKTNGKCNNILHSIQYLNNNNNSNSNSNNKNDTKDAKHETNYRVPTWVVQGTDDAICPDKFARRLVKRLEEEGVLENAYFVNNAGHKSSSNGIKHQLIVVVQEFLALLER